LTVAEETRARFPLYGARMIRLWSDSRLNNCIAAADLENFRRGLCNS